MPRRRSAARRFASDPPYLAEIVAATERSLEAGAYCYLDFLFNRSPDLKVVHPWAWDAYTQLQGSRPDWDR